MTASIIIATYHRKNSLVRLLKSLKGVKAEIIIVEQGENNRQVYEPYNVRYFFLKNPSTVKAENLGAKKAKGDILLFFDDDVIVKSNTVSYHLKNYKNASIGAVVGRVVTDGQPIESKATNTARINFWLDFEDHYSSTIPQEVDTLIGCNMSVRRDLFKRVGGFDENFTWPALRFESDLSQRIIKEGYRIRFDPKAEVRHVRESKGGSRKSEGKLKWYYNFFKNEMYFALKHRPLYVLPVVLFKRIFLFL